ncbi:MAG TPA: hypothetical protein VJT15_06850 [Pyrinomonadaceae bacterium]|nr:hypothetical protein [Pyrinomonadaceae bacterium]
MTLNGRKIIGTATTVHRYLTGKHQNTLLAYWIVLSGVILAIDYFTGSVIQFPFMFIVPVGLAAWYNGARSALAFAILLPLIRLYFTTIFSVPWGFPVSVANAGIRIGMLVSYALLIAYIAKQKKGLEREINILEGILPICSFCKKIRDELSIWQPMESYITARSEASFSHSLCPECKERHYGDFLRQRKEMAQSK